WSFQTSWENTVGHLFHYLDVDGDGTLSKKEATLAPSNTQWVQLMTGTTVEPDAAPDFAALAGGPNETKVTRAHFVRYYQNSGAGALQVEWGWRPPTQDVLHALDLDGDEIIRAVELAPNGAYPVFTFRSTTNEQPVPKTFPFVIL